MGSHLCLWALDLNQFEISRTRAGLQGPLVSTWVALGAISKPDLVTVTLLSLECHSVWTLDLQTKGSKDINMTHRELVMRVSTRPHSEIWREITHSS